MVDPNLTISNDRFSVFSIFFHMLQSHLARKHTDNPSDQQWCLWLCFYSTYLSAVSKQREWDSLQTQAAGTLSHKTTAHRLSRKTLKAICYKFMRWKRADEQDWSWRWCKQPGYGSRVNQSQRFGRLFVPGVTFSLTGPSCSLRQASVERHDWMRIHLGAAPLKFHLERKMCQHRS